MAETQMDHRMGIEKSVVQSDIKRADRGLLYGFIVALVVTASGVWITLTDKSAFGLVAMLAPLTGILGLFIYNKQSQKSVEGQPSSPPKTKKNGKK